MKARATVQMDDPTIAYADATKADSDSNVNPNQAFRDVNRIPMQMS